MIILKHFLGKSQWFACELSVGELVTGKRSAFPLLPWYNEATMVQFDDTYNAAKMASLRKNEEEHLLQQLAAQYGYSYVSLPGITINPEALLTITEDEAHEAKAAGFELKNKQLSIAIRNPNNPATTALIEKLKAAGWKLTIMMCSTASLEHAWARYEDQKQSVATRQGVLDIDPDAIAALIKKLKALEDVSAYIIDIRTLNSARRISQTLEAVFAGAIALGASDVHLEPEATNVRVRYRLDGVLHDVINLQHVVFDRLISRLKLLSGMRLNVRDEAQDGRFSFTIGEQDVEVRASIIPGSSGESMVMRLLDPSVASFQFESLGLNSVMKSVMEAELARPNGLIITTGPTGSGKTTALYAFLQKVHTEDRKIITIEDPVEYKLDDIVQTQVSDDYSFASGLRAVLRQDPDVIMIGEIRDAEVAQTALHAAQTGHLVFSTLHTNSAVGAFPRLIDLGVDYRTLGSAINIILGQRLVRVLCEQCKSTYEASPAEEVVVREGLQGHPAPPTLTTPLMLYKAPGCAFCSESGYKGRQGIYEAVRMDAVVEEAILRDPREHIIVEASQGQGIPSMVHDGLEKVLSGTTSLEELQRVIDVHSLRSKAAPTVDTEGEAPEDEVSAHVVDLS